MKTINLETVFQDFLATEDLQNQKLLIMVSGGIDSMVLLDVALKNVAPEQLAVFHLDHQAREDSEEDFKFVQNICSELNIKFYSDALIPLKKGETGGSQEANWRQSRQNLSQEAAQDFHAARILTGHHATDLVETMVFRLSKGTGPNGLSPFNTHTKPFWQVTKADIKAYAKAQNIKWCEDPTNENTKYRRNLIRHQVLPALREITPNLEKVFVHESQLFDEVDEFLQISTPPTNQPLPLADFMDLHPAIQKTWLRQLSGVIPSLSEIEDCLKWLRGSPEGNTKKKLGEKTLWIKEHSICF